VDVAVLMPADPARKALIDLMAKFCAADGEAFEKVRASSISHIVLATKTRCCSTCTSAHYSDRLVSAQSL
jgi:hypothetical protein